MPVLFKSPHYTLEQVDISHVLRCVRSEVPFDDEIALTHAHVDLARALDTIDRERHAMLVDLRRSRANYIPGFEEAMKRARRILLARFHRSAVVVKTAAGMLQVQRHMREDALDTRVFLDDESAALAYLTAPADVRWTVDRESGFVEIAPLSRQVLRKAR
jgi:hypothetical protein